MDREWEWGWPGAGEGGDITLAAVRATLEAVSRVGVVPRGGEARVGVMRGGVDRGVLLPLIFSMLLQVLLVLLVLLKQLVLL